MQLGSPNLTQKSETIADLEGAEPAPLPFGLNFDRFTVKHALKLIFHQWLSDSFRVHQIRFSLCPADAAGKLTALPQTF